MEDSSGINEMVAGGDKTNKGGGGRRRKKGKRKSGGGRASERQEQDRGVNRIERQEGSGDMEDSSDTFRIIGNNQFQRMLSELKAEVFRERQIERQTIENLETSFAKLREAVIKASMSINVNTPNELGLQIRMQAGTNSFAVPSPLSHDEAERIWPSTAWPTDGSRILESQFKEAIESIILDECCFKITFGGLQYDDQIGLNKQSDFCIHLKEFGSLPCYTSALLSLYSKSTGKYNSKGEIGSIAMKAVKILRASGPARTAILAGLTDGRKIEWLLLQSLGEEERYTYTFIPQINDVRESLCAMLKSPPSGVYFLQRQVSVHANPVTFLSFLGSGATSNVYKGKYKEQEVVVKCFHSAYTAENDYSYLQKLKGIKGVPSCLGTSDDMSMLLLSPVDKKVKKLAVEKKIKPLLGGIVDILKAAHEREIVHRDVRMENILLVNDEQFYLIDWGFASGLGQQKALPGNYLLGSDSLSQKLFQQTTVALFPSDDLVTLVRSLYVFCNPCLRYSWAARCNTRSAASKFWSMEFSTSAQWAEAEEIARNKDYDGLKGWIQMWAENYWYN